jgi:putative ABC transport system substrate-binding protein
VVITGVGDPVGQGIIASLARPGGNITGLSATVTEIYPKRVEILGELVPKATRIAALFNMGNPAIPRQWKEVETAARSLGLQAHLLDVRKVEDPRPAFETAVRQHADAMIVGARDLPGRTRRSSSSWRQASATGHVRLDEFAGGLASYGVNYPDHYRRAATFADKIFKGAKPADLPVEQPTKLELVVNLRTARALGLTIPRTVLLQVDKMIE